MDGIGRVESGTETENNAYVHGWTVLVQCIPPWMVGSRVMQEQLPRSYYRGRLHGCKWYDSKDGIGRVESGTETENDSLGKDARK